MLLEILIRIWSGIIHSLVNGASAVRAIEKDMLRRFGNDLVGVIPWGTHLCQFYETKQDLIDILVPYFAEGLHSNEFCMWITSVPLEVDEATRALKEAVPDLEEYVKNGQIEIISYNNWYLLDGKFDANRVLQSWIEKENAALKRGFEGLRLTGNTLWVERDLWKSFVDYEEAINSVIGEHRIMAVCTYCLTSCSGTDVVDVVRNHVGTLIKQIDKWYLVEDAARRKAVNGALKLTEQKYSALFENMQDCFAYHKVLFDETGKPVDYVFLEINNAFERLTGLKRENILGRRVTQVLPGIENDPANWIGVYGKVALTGEPVRCENYFEDLHRWYLISAYSPQHGYFVATFEDVTERKKSEELLVNEKSMLRGIMENTGVMLAYFDPQFNFVVVNSAYAKGSGHTVEDLIGKNHFVLFPNEENQAIFEKVRDTGEVITFFDKQFEFANQLEGGVTYWDWTLAPVKNEMGQVQGLILSLFETTQRKKAETMIKRQSMIQKGVNRILGEALSARTEEALGEMCLVVAEEITDSKFGFIGEINEGGLQDVSISNSGWDACVMHDLNGQRPPSNLIHGIYGRVLLDGKGLFTNDPANHPDSIGLPFGHPPLQSFLGVPLKDDGKTIGIIAVANREGGYSEADLEALEALAPAIVEAFMRKRSEEILLEQNLVISSVSDAIFSTDNSFIFKTWNKAAEHIFGWTAEEVIGKATISVFNPIYHNSNGTKWEHIMDELMKNGFWRGEIIYHKKGGSPIPVSVSASLVKDENKNVTGIVTVAHDISARKKREEILKETQQDLNRAQSVAKTGSWRLDTQRNILHWSDENYRIFGVSKGTPLTYETFLEFVYPDDREYVNEKWKAGLRGEPYDIEHRIIVDERVKWVREKAELEFDENGTLLGGFGTTQDITDMVEMREKLSFYSKHLEELVEEKTWQLKGTERLAAIGQTAGMIGHDIRNPLQSIDGAIYLAKGDVESLPDGSKEKEELEEILDLIKEQVSYINHMVTDLQDFARTAPPQFEETIIQESITESLSMVKIPENIQVNVILSANPLKLTVDCTDMKRIFVNLIKNAVQAMPNGGELTIKVLQKEKEAWICIEDTGVGIAKEIKPKLFTPLFTTKSKGQGFGLAVCKKLIEAQSGEITFDSEVGKGSTFIIKLPLKREA